MGVFLLPVHLQVVGEVGAGAETTPALCSLPQNSVPLRSLRPLSKDMSQLRAGKRLRES